MSTDPRIQAYEMGYYSGVNGEDPRVCPFPKMTAEWKAWNEAQAHGAEMHRYATRWAEKCSQRGGQ